MPRSTKELTRTSPRLDIAIGVDRQRGPFRFLELGAGHFGRKPVRD